MIEVYIAGLPNSAKKYIGACLDVAFQSMPHEIKDISSDLRVKVNLATRNTNVILVILDEYSYKSCSDIIPKFKTSEEIYKYVGDKGLVDFLNANYDTDLVCEDEPVVVMGISDDEPEESDLVKSFKKKVKYQDTIIKNLKIKIEDLTGRLEGITVLPMVDDTNIELFKELKNENMTLRDKILSLEKNTEVTDSSILEYQNQIDIYLKEIESSENKYNSLFKDYEGLIAQVSKLTLEISNLEGVLKVKEDLLESSNEKIGRVEVLEKDLELCNIDKKDLNLEIERLNNEVSDLIGQVELLKSEKTDSKVVQEVIENLSSENKNLKNRVLELEKDRKSSESYISEIESLQNRIKVDSNSLMELNKIKIDLETKVECYKKASSGGNVNLIMNMGVLKDKILAYENSIFTKLGNLASIKSSLEVPLLKDTEFTSRLANVSFVFSGTTESRKGTYKFIKEKMLDGNTGNLKRYLIVDLVTESYMDYVFIANNLTDGSSWLSTGGEIEKHLSHCSEDSIRLMSMGLSFINDLYFLTVDWESRLKELENSGYEVVIYCGDLSNSVSRVLYETFKNGNITIYQKGSLVGNRSLILNLKGINTDNINVRVKVFEYNDKGKSLLAKIKNVVDVEILG